MEEKRIKLFTQKEVEEKIMEFNGYMLQEKALSEEIMSLKLYGPKEQFRENQSRHDEILEEIDDIRMKKMIPILEELSLYVAYCQKVEKGEIKFGDPWPGPPPEGK
jgi:hypothetical protein